MRMDRYMRLVIAEHAFVEAAEFVRLAAAARLEPERQHVFRAAADHRLDLFDAQQRTIRKAKRIVDRRQQVSAGVEEGAVEVEADDIE